jgi:hypothetical protein
MPSIRRVSRWCDRLHHIVLIQSKCAVRSQPAACGLILPACFWWGYSLGRSHLTDLNLSPCPATQRPEFSRCIPAAITRRTTTNLKATMFNNKNIFALTLSDQFRTSSNWRKAQAKRYPHVKEFGVHDGRQRSHRFRCSRHSLILDGTLDDCIRQFMAKPISQHHLYEIHTAPQGELVSAVLLARHIVEIARLRDFL